MWEIFVRGFSQGKVPDDWKGSIIIPLYKGKGNKRECKNSRGISILSVAGKVYGSILIERARRINDKMIGDEQGGFGSGRGCVDQIFAMRQLIEKCGRKGKKVFAAFIDLEKAYDRIDRDGLWKVLEIYGVDGNLLERLKVFTQVAEHV